MCFGGGGGGSPQAPATTPAVPVDQITAGHPTVTVTQNPSQNPPDPAPRSSDTPPAAQSSSGSGLTI
jgi:hypothetical protein